jgi:hypothetical protein
LRGSAGIAPASLSSPTGKDAQTERTILSKNGKYFVKGIYRDGMVEVKRRNNEGAFSDRY